MTIVDNDDDDDDKQRPVKATTYTQSGNNLTAQSDNNLTVWGSRSTRISCPSNKP